MWQVTESRGRKPTITVTAKCCMWMDKRSQKRRPHTSSLFCSDLKLINASFVEAVLSFLYSKRHFVPPASRGRFFRYIFRKATC